MNLFDLQLSVFRAWTDTAQAMLKASTDAALAVSRAATEQTETVRRELQPPTNPLMPFAGAWHSTQAWPFFPLQALVPTLGLGSASAMHPWLQLFAPRAWPFSGAQPTWPFAGMMPFGAWQGAVSPFSFGLPAAGNMFGAWPFGWQANSGAGNALWPMAMFFQSPPSGPFSWVMPQQLASLPWLPVPSTGHGRWSMPTLWTAFKRPDARAESRAQELADRAKAVSFRTSSGHATAAVIMSPADIARSIATFWSIDPDPAHRKPH